MSSLQTTSQRASSVASKSSPFIKVRVTHQRPRPIRSPAWKTRRLTPRGVPPMISDRLRGM